MNKHGYFVGKLHAFDKKTDDTVIEDKDVVIELTSCDQYGVEVAFDDRNERVYLKFQLADLARAVQLFSENDE